MIEGLADSATLDRLQDLGGLCLPHVQAAATAGPRPPVARLTETLRDAVEAPGPQRRDWLAGTDPDAETRAVMRRSVPPTGVRTPASCSPCLAGAQAERDALERLPGLASDGPEPGLTLCAGHLADAAAGAGAGGLRMLLIWQARCLTAQLEARHARWLPHGRQRRDSAGECAVCRTRRDAARRALADVGAGGSDTGSALCVRHHLVLRVADPRSSNVLVPAAVDVADALVRELAEAFDSAFVARSRGASAADSGAWRRAAVFLDGAVFGGYPARP
jgi:hypothetical protein